MQCKACPCELRILQSHMEFTGDESPDTETKAWQVMELGCQNRQCPEYGKVQTTERVELN